VGSVTRPVKELKAFKKLNFEAGETKSVQFELKENDYSFFREGMSFGTEPGDFKIFVGGNSIDVKETTLTLE